MTAVADVLASWGRSKDAFAASPPGASATVDGAREALAAAAVAALVAAPVDAVTRHVHDRVLWAGLVYPGIRAARASLKKVDPLSDEHERRVEALHALVGRRLPTFFSLLERLADAQQAVAAVPASAGAISRRALAAACAQLYVYLGDLFRYEAEAPLRAAPVRVHAASSVPEAWRSALLAYLHAALADPPATHPHNQLAVVAQAAGADVLCAYRWMRAQAPSGGGGAMAAAARAALQERLELNRTTLERLEADPRVRRLGAIGPGALAAGALLVTVLPGGARPAGGGDRGRAGLLRGAALRDAEAPGGGGSALRVAADAAARAREPVVVLLSPGDVAPVPAAPAGGADSEAAFRGAVVAVPFAAATLMLPLRRRAGDGGAPPPLPVPAATALLLVTLERVVRLAGMVVLGTDLERLPQLSRNVARDVGRLAAAQGARALAGGSGGALLPPAWLPRVFAMLAFAVDAAPPAGGDAAAAASSAAPRTAAGSAAPPSAAVAAATRARVRRAYALLALCVVTARVAKAAASFVRAAGSADPQRTLAATPSRRRARDASAVGGGAGRRQHTATAARDAADCVEGDDEVGDDDDDETVVVDEPAVGRGAPPLGDAGIVHLCGLLSLSSAFADWLPAHAVVVEGPTGAAGAADARRGARALDSGDPGVVEAHGRRVLLDALAALGNKLERVLPSLVAPLPLAPADSQLPEEVELRGFAPFRVRGGARSDGIPPARITNSVLAVECAALTHGDGEGEFVGAWGFDGGALLQRAHKIVRTVDALAVMPGCTLRRKGVGGLFVTGATCAQPSSASLIKASSVADVPVSGSAVAPAVVQPVQPRVYDAGLLPGEIILPISIGGFHELAADNAGSRRWGSAAGIEDDQGGLLLPPALKEVLVPGADESDFAEGRDGPLLSAGVHEGSHVLGARLDALRSVFGGAEPSGASVKASLGATPQLDADDDLYGALEPDGDETQPQVGDEA